MNKFLPTTWVALHVVLATAATVLLCSTDVLQGAQYALLIH